MVLVFVDFVFLCVCGEERAICLPWFIYLWYINTEILQLDKVLTFQPFCFIKLSSCNREENTSEKKQMFYCFIQFFLSMTLMIISNFYVKTSQPPLGNKSITLSNYLLIACFVE